MNEKSSVTGPDRAVMRSRTRRMRLVVLTAVMACLLVVWWIGSTRIWGQEALQNRARLEVILDLYADDPVVMAELLAARARDGDGRALGRLIELVEHVESAARRSAVRQLATVAESRVIDPLLRATGDRSAMVRAAAAEGLGVRRDSTALPALAGMLGDDEMSVRLAAVGALCRFDEAAVAHVAPLMGSGTPHERASAASVLLTVQPRRVAWLEQAANDGSVAVRLAAVRALGQSAGPEHLPTLRRLYHGSIGKSELSGAVANEAAMMLAVLGDAEGMAAVVRRAHEEPSFDTMIVVNRSGDRGLSLLGEMVADAALAMELRQTALAMIVRQPDSGGRTAVLSKVLQGRWSAGRVGAVQGLAEADDPDGEVAGALITAVSDGEAAVRAAAAEAIGARELQTGGDGVDRLLAALTATSPGEVETRMALVEAVGRHGRGREDVIAALAAICQEASATGRRALLAAGLESIGRAGGEGERALLERHAKSEDAEVRAGALRGIGWLGDDQAVAFLIATLAQDAPGRAAAVEALALTESPDVWQILIGLVDDADEAMRHAARVALSQRGAAEVVVEAMRQASDIQVRQVLAEVLVEMGEAALPPVRQALAEKMGDESAVPELIWLVVRLDRERSGAKLRPYLLSESPKVRATAAWGLGVWRDGSAGYALRELAESDPDERVRHAAEMALRRLRRSL